MEIDLSDPLLYSHGDPHAAWSWLREHDPVRWQGGFWSVTRYADVDSVLKEHESFTSERGTLLNLLGRNDPAAGRQISATDPPLHDRMRQPLQQAMGLRAVQPHSEVIRAGVRRLLAPAVNGEPFDFAAAMNQLPMVVIGPLLGLSDQDWPMLARWVAMSSAEDDPSYRLPGGPRETLDHAHRELFAYLLDVVVKRQRAPGEDLISVLLATGSRAGAVVSNCYSLVLGAGATIPNVPAATLLHLITHGGYTEWAARPDLLASGVEEALRWASPASHFMRHTLVPVTLSGVHVGPGEPVVAWIGSANRDETVFAEPFRFRPDRQPNRHLAFGSGRHYCIGSHIARLTLRALFDELFASFTSFELAGEVARISSPFLAGIKQMPVIAQPRKRNP